MNIDQEYSLMCSLATEIQEIRKLWEPGDKRLTLPFMTGYSAEKQPGEIWLPRQEDLQPMVDEKYANISILTGYFFDFTRERYPLYNCAPVCIYGMTMDKLWLMFVMCKNHKKV